MLLVYGAEGRWTDEERRACMAESVVVRDRLAAEGRCLAAAPLAPVADAVTVRVRDGRAIVTDGPFAETIEQLGGFYLLELADLDEAIAAAAALPPATLGTIEIRPVLALDGLPPARPLPEGAAVESLRPFLLLCYDDPAAWEAAGPEALRAAMMEAAGLASTLDDAGRYVGAAPLHPPETATCVRVRDGRRAITDGPFAETHEVLGGYYLVLTGSREEAVGIAARHPGARRGAVEVRPILDPSGAGGSGSDS
jgi:hypothetical protein